MIPGGRRETEDDVMYDGPIIDAHTHLWDLSLDRHPWLRPQDTSVQAVPGMDRIRRDFVEADYVSAAAGQNIVASVHVEALWDANDPVGETEWLDTLDKSRGVAVRYTAAAPLGTPQAQEILERQAAHARVVGIRDILSFHPTEPEKSFASRDDKAQDPAWRRDVARLAGFGFVLELMMYPYQLDAVLDVARSFPDLRILVNHCASPIDRDEEGMRRWRDSVRLLGREPNVAIKVSNPWGYDPEPTDESIRAVVLHCIECFGTDRTIFGSDWPVARVKVELADIYDAYRRITAKMTPAEQRALFHDNAKRIYRIDGNG
jgi:predicted TIM-barrel fold metal-dependent hydrolase